MAALHTALASLSPTPYSAVPTSPPADTTAYLTTAFHNACTIIDSVPLPPPPTSPTPPIPRPRSSTTASSSSEISTSSLRAPPLLPTDPPAADLQKEWGKPIKLSAKDNPLGMSVYKASGRDGRGAWFARRSVHEGLGFGKWKRGLQREFPESLEVGGGPGEGNVRGIGGERRVEGWGVRGVGGVEVYHLSAQFPGPTTPRDFVTLLLTSSSALPDKGGGFRDRPRHFLVISRPCEHPECPPRDGFIRGQYESVEFIREIPREKDRKSMSASNLLSPVKSEGGEIDALEREAVLRSAMKKSGLSPDDHHPADDINLRPEVKTEMVREGRRRGKTISFAGSRGESAKGEKHDNPDSFEDDESNPVEWIMITRSDPGGSVPRFMVERGTPGGIVADASKFLDWACKKEHPDDEGDTESLLEGDPEHADHHADDQRVLHAAELNGHSAGVEGVDDAPDDTATTTTVTPDPPLAPPKPAPEAIIQPQPLAQPDAPTLQPESTSSSGIIDTVAKAAYASLETYAPQVVLDRLPKHSPSPSISASLGSLRGNNNNNNSSSSEDPTPAPNSRSPAAAPSPPRSPSLSTISSVGSWASAEDHFDPPNDGSGGGDDTLSTKSSQTLSKEKSTASMTPHEKELAKLEERKRTLNDKLAKAKEKETKDKAELTSKEQERVKRAEEKHAQEVAKQEEKYKREIAKLDAKRRKEAAKIEERKRRAEEKDERVKLAREREELRVQLEVVGREREILKEQVGALQKENTLLVAKMGRMVEEGGAAGGRDVLREIRAQGEGGRGRSGSLRREGGGGTGAGGEESGGRKENGGVVTAAAGAK